MTSKPYQIHDAEVNFFREMSMEVIKLAQPIPLVYVTIFHWKNVGK